MIGVPYWVWGSSLIWSAFHGMMAAGLTWITEAGRTTQSKWAISYQLCHLLPLIFFFFPCFEIWHHQIRGYKIQPECTGGFACSSSLGLHFNKTTGCFYFIFVLGNSWQVQRVRVSFFFFFFFFFSSQNIFECLSPPSTLGTRSTQLSFSSALHVLLTAWFSSTTPPH